MNMTDNKPFFKPPFRGQGRPTPPPPKKTIDIDPLIDEICELAERRDAMRELVAAGGKPLKPEFTPELRAEILQRTGGHCYVCGGKVEDAWAAVPVLMRPGATTADPEVYLPAHHVCSNYRIDYLAEEFQLMLRLGVWMRAQIERESDLGLEMAEKFMKSELDKQKRRERKAAKAKKAIEGGEPSPDADADDDDDDDAPAAPKPRARRTKA